MIDKQEAKPMTKSQQNSFRMSKEKVVPVQPVPQPVQKPTINVEAVRNFDKQLMLELAEDRDSWIAYDWEGDEAVSINVDATVVMLKQVISQRFDNNPFPSEMQKPTFKKLPKTVIPKDEDVDAFPDVPEDEDLI